MAVTQMHRRSNPWWPLGLVVTLLLGITIPPLGIALSLLGAAIARRSARQTWMRVYLALAAAFVVLTILVGTFLFAVEGGGGSSVSGA